MFDLLNAQKIQSQKLIQQQKLSSSFLVTEKPILGGTINDVCMYVCMYVDDSYNMLLVLVTQVMEQTRMKTWQCIGSGTVVVPCLGLSGVVYGAVWG